MAILVTELAKVDVLANPTGSNVIGEVSGKIVRITTQKIIDMVSEQIQDPNKSDIAVTGESIKLLRSFFDAQKITLQ